MAGATVWAPAIDALEWAIRHDEALEKGENVFPTLQVGATVLIECPQRWYAGRVTDRNSLTVTLGDALCAHDLGDLGMFLDGTISESTELTPLPGPIDISLSCVQSAQPYPHLEKVRRRTHAPLKAKA